MDDKEPYKIHGIISSDSDSDIENKKDFDEEYNLLKSPPFDNEQIKNNLIKILSKKPKVFNVCEERLKHMSNNNGKNKQMEKDIGTANVRKKKKKKAKGRKLLMPNDTSDVYEANAVNKEEISVSDEISVLHSDKVPTDVSYSVTGIWEEKLKHMANNNGKNYIDIETSNVKNKKKCINFFMLNDVNDMYEDNIVDIEEISSNNEMAVLHSGKIPTDVFNSALSPTMVKYPVKQKTKEGRKSKEEPPVDILNDTGSKSVKGVFNTSKSNNRNEIDETLNITPNQLVEKNIPQKKNSTNVHSIIANNNLGVVIKSKKQKKKKQISTPCRDVEMYDYETNTFSSTFDRNFNTEKGNLTNSGRLTVSKSNNNEMKKKSDQTVNRTFQSTISEGCFNQFNKKERNRLKQMLDGLKNEDIWHTEITGQIQKEASQLKRKEADMYKTWLKRKTEEKRNEKKKRTKNIITADDETILQQIKTSDYFSEEMPSNRNEEKNNIKQNTNVTSQGSKKKNANTKKMAKNIRNDVRCFYYEFEGKNFEHFMDFKDRYLHMSLDKEYRKLKLCGKHKNVVAVKCGIKNNVDKSKVESKMATNIRNDVRCFYYEFEGKNFEHFMDFKDRYLHMSLDKEYRKLTLCGKHKNVVAVKCGIKNNVDKSKVESEMAANIRSFKDRYLHMSLDKEGRKLKVCRQHKSDMAVKCDIKNDMDKNRGKSEPLRNLRDDVRCFYYEFEGKNFEYFMEFRERYLCISLDDVSKVKRSETKIICIKDVPDTKYSLSLNNCNDPHDALSYVCFTGDSPLPFKLLHL